MNYFRCLSMISVFLVILITLTYRHSVKEGLTQVELSYNNLYALHNDINTAPDLKAAQDKFILYNQAATELYNQLYNNKDAAVYRSSIADMNKNAINAISSKGRGVLNSIINSSDLNNAIVLLKYLKDNKGTPENIDIINYSIPYAQDDIIKKIGIRYEEMRYYLGFAHSGLKEGRSKLISLIQDIGTYKDDRPENNRQIENIITTAKNDILRVMVNLTNERQIFYDWSTLKDAQSVLLSLKDGIPIFQKEYDPQKEHDYIATVQLEVNKKATSLSNEIIGINDIQVAKNKLEYLKANAGSPIVSQIQTAIDNAQNSINLKIAAAATTPAATTPAKTTASTTTKPVFPRMTFKTIDMGNGQHMFVNEPYQKCDFFTVSFTVSAFSGINSIFEIWSYHTNTYDHFNKSMIKLVNITSTGEYTFTQQNPTPERYNQFRFFQYAGSSFTVSSLIINGTQQLTAPNPNPVVLPIPASTTPARTTPAATTPAATTPAATTPAWTTAFATTPQPVFPRMTFKTTNVTGAAMDGGTRYMFRNEPYQKCDFFTVSFTVSAFSGERCIFFIIGHPTSTNTNETLGDTWGLIYITRTGEYSITKQNPTPERYNEFRFMQERGSSITVSSLIINGTEQLTGPNPNPLVLPIPAPTTPAPTTTASTTPVRTTPAATTPASTTAYSTTHASTTAYSTTPASTSVLTSMPTDATDIMDDVIDIIYLENPTLSKIPNSTGKTKIDKTLMDKTVISNNLYDLVLAYDPKIKQNPDVKSCMEMIYIRRYVESFMNVIPYHMFPINIRETVLFSFWNSGELYRKADVFLKEKNISIPPLPYSNPYNYTFVIPDEFKQLYVEFPDFLIYEINYNKHPTVIAYNLKATIYVFNDILFKTPIPIETNPIQTNPIQTKTINSVIAKYIVYFKYLLDSIKNTTDYKVKFHPYSQYIDDSYTAYDIHYNTINTFFNNILPTPASTTATTPAFTTAYLTTPAWTSAYATTPLSTTPAWTSAYVTTPYTTDEPTTGYGSSYALLPELTNSPFNDVNTQPINNIYPNDDTHKMYDKYLGKVVLKSGDSASSYMMRHPPDPKYKGIYKNIIENSTLIDFFKKAFDTYS